MNAIFDPELYSRCGGIIIDYDPAKADRERARQRSIARMKDEENKLKNKYYRRLKKQKMYGVLYICLGLALSVSAIWIGELVLWGMLLMTIGIFAIKSRKIVFYIE